MLITPTNNALYAALSELAYTRSDSDQDIALLDIPGALDITQLQMAQIEDVGGGRLDLSAAIEGDNERGFSYFYDSENSGFAVVAAVVGEKTVLAFRGTDVDLAGILDQGPAIAAALALGPVAAFSCIGGTWIK